MVFRLLFYYFNSFNTVLNLGLTLIVFLYTIIREYKMTHMTDGGREQWKTEKFI